MITFNPDRRYTVKECLQHPYFDGLHNPDEEPESKALYNWSWDNFEPTTEVLREMVYKESLSFHPLKPE
jgi:mitogen-activated protein kinase 1/3